jgi:hypothetical protein
MSVNTNTDGHPHRDPESCHHAVAVTVTDALLDGVQLFE